MDRHHFVRDGEIWKCSACPTIARTEGSYKRLRSAVCRPHLATQAQRLEARHQTALGKLLPIWTCKYGRDSTHDIAYRAEVWYCKHCGGFARILSNMDYRCKRIASARGRANLRVLDLGQSPIKLACEAAAGPVALERWFTGGSTATSFGASTAGAAEA